MWRSTGGSRHDSHEGSLRADIIAARQAIDFFEEKQLRAIKNVAAYHLQQAVEKLIKLQIYANRGSVSNSQMYTHNIQRLITYADSLSFGVNIPDYVRERSLQITDWEVGSRYDVQFSVRIDVLKKALAVVSEWERQVR